MESSSFEDVNRLVRSDLYEHMDPESGHEPSVLRQYNRCEAG